MEGSGVRGVALHFVVPVVLFFSDDRIVFFLPEKSTPHVPSDRGESRGLDKKL